MDKFRYIIYKVRAAALSAALCLVFMPCGAQNIEVLDVERCVEMALSNSMEVRNSALDVTAARLQKQEALAEYFPSVNATGFAFHSLSPMIDISVVDVLGRSDMAYILQNRLEEMAAPYGISTKYRAMQHGYAGTLSLTQPVYLGGRVVHGNRLADLGVRAAGARNSLQRRQSEEDVRKLFYQVLALQYKRQTLEFTAGLLDTLYKDVSSAVSAGLALRTDLTALELKMEELRAGRGKLDAGLRIAKMNLLDRTGMKYNAYRSVESEYPYIDSFVLEGDFDGIMTPDSAYVDEESIVAGLDEAALLQMQVEAKAIERRMTLGEVLPSVVFGASYGYSRMLTTPKFNGAMYAVLQIPITDWGKKSRKLERQGIEIRKAENQRDFYRDQLLLQIRQLYMELSYSYDMMTIARRQEELASLRLEQLRSSYDAGLCTLAELLAAENDSRDSAGAAVDATLDYLSVLQEYRVRVK